MSAVKCLAYDAHLCMQKVTDSVPLMCCAHCPYNEGCEYKCHNSPKRCGQSRVTMDMVPVPARKPVKDKRQCVRKTTFRKVEKLHPDTMEMLETYESAEAAATQCGLKKHNIYIAINRGTKHGSYYWRYKKEEQ